MVLAEVRRLRLNLPSVGAEILHHQLTNFRQQHGIKIGRDKFDTSDQAHRMQGELVKKWRVTKPRQKVKMQVDESMAAA